MGEAGGILANMAADWPACSVSVGKLAHAKQTQSLFRKKSARNKGIVSLATARRLADLFLSSFEANKLSGCNQIGSTYLNFQLWGSQYEHFPNAEGRERLEKTCLLQPVSFLH